MSNNSKNGAAVAPKNETVKTETTIVNKETAAQPPKENAPGAKPEPPKVEIMTIEQQQTKARQLQNLFEKRSKLLETQETLEEFNLSTDAQTNRLTLDDGKGAKFTTTSPAVIEHVLGIVRVLVGNMVKDSENQILSI
jgi:hypothetical protein